MNDNPPLEYNVFTIKAYSSGSNLIPIGIWVNLPLKEKLVVKVFLQIVRNPNYIFSIITFNIL